MVYNTTTDFNALGDTARCIYATEDGLISMWAGGDSAFTVADRSTMHASYKGLTIANDGSDNYLYATDFFNNKVDVFDKNFNYVASRQLVDPGLPSGYTAYNVSNINGQLFVAYVTQKYSGGTYDYEAPGNGIIDVFTPDGSFVRRFSSGGALNLPWGMISAPVSFGQGANTILVANNGDGKINVFDTSGNYLGPLENNGAPIVIDGIWDLAFNPSDGTQLFFSAGPEDGKYGLFGYIKLQ
jgi:uncharacterized protein (TIGR03118 family)